VAEVEEAPLLRPPDRGSGSVAGTAGGRPRCWLVVTHTPSRGRLGAKLEVQEPRFTIGAGDDDLPVDGATQSGTRVEIIWTGTDEPAAPTEWRIRGQGRVWVNGETVVNRALRSGDELRVVDTHFRFLSGQNLDDKYHETIYHLTITDFATGIYNQRYLKEVLNREAIRTNRYGKDFWVAVIEVERKGAIEESDHDLLRSVADRLKRGGLREWFIARTANLQLVVAAPGTAAEFESELTSLVQPCVTAKVQIRLGAAQPEPGNTGDQWLQLARDRMTRVPG
jgi:GGDEF domain-containing protein